MDKDRWCSQCARQGHPEYQCKYAYGRAHSIQTTTISEYTDVYGYTTSAGHSLPQEATASDHPNVLNTSYDVMLPPPPPNVSFAIPRHLSNRGPELESSNQNTSYDMMFPPPPPNVSFAIPRCLPNHGPELESSNQSNTPDREVPCHSLPHLSDQDLSQKEGRQASRKHPTSIFLRTTGIKYDMLQSKQFKLYLLKITKRTGVIIELPQSKQNGKLTFYGPSLVTHQTMFKINQYLKTLVKQHEKKHSVMSENFHVQLCDKLSALNHVQDVYSSLCGTYKQIQNIECSASDKKAEARLFSLYRKLHGILYGLYQVGKGKIHMKLIRRWLETGKGATKKQLTSAYKCVFNNGWKNKLDYVATIKSLNPVIS